MVKEKDTQKEKKASEEEHAISFLKVDKLLRRTHAMELLLRNDDIIVGLNGQVFRGTQKLLNQKLKDKESKLKVLTIQRKDIFFNIKVERPLGIKLIEVSSEEATELLNKTVKYLEKKYDFASFYEYEVFKGKKNYYDIIENNEASLFASLLPFVWFVHHKLYSPLLLLGATFILLGSIEWWLFLAAWVITTIYMSKSSISLLRGYCMFNEMRPYMKIFSSSNKDVQETVRKIDVKSRYRFPMISPPDILDINNKEEKDVEIQQAT
jgi:hypothetical protein